MIARWEHASDCIIDNIIRVFFFFFFFVCVKFNWTSLLQELYHLFTICHFFRNNNGIYTTEILQDFVYYTLKSFAILLIYRWTRTNPSVLEDRRQIFFPSDLFPYYPKWSSRTARAVWKIWPSPTATHKTQDSKWRRNK